MLYAQHPGCKAFFGLLELSGEKEALPESHQIFEVTATQTSGLVNLVLPRQTGFFECEQRFIDKPMVINDHAVASTRWLGLGSKLYPSSMPCMLNKDLIRSTQNHSGSEQAKERLCWQGVRLTVCMSNENADVTDVINSNRKFDVSLDGTLLSHALF